MLVADVFGIPTIFKRSYFTLCEVISQSNILQKKVFGIIFMGDADIAGHTLQIKRKKTNAEKELFICWFS